MKDYSLIKTQTLTSEEDYSMKIERGFEFVPDGKIVTKLTIFAKTNLKLIVKNNSEVMELYIEQGSAWSVDNNDGCDFTSIVCDNPKGAICTFMLGYRNK